LAAKFQTRSDYHNLTMTTDTSAGHEISSLAPFCIALLPKLRSRLSGTTVALPDNFWNREARTIINETDLNIFKR
jgi:hypothetical protein